MLPIVQALVLVLEIKLNRIGIRTRARGSIGTSPSARGIEGISTDLEGCSR